MSREYSIMVPAQNSIYAEDYRMGQKGKRTLQVRYCEPEQLDEDTGLLLLIAGYGGNSESNIFKKMRSVLSDKYNLIVVQCEYFGSQSMQTPSLEEKLEILRQCLPLEPSKIGDDGCREYLYIYKLNETVYDMNDMGIMQATDNITAVLSVIKIMKERGNKINLKKTIAYGFSHGAYLSYYCNRICPKLFQLLIDNSSYIVPHYIEKLRNVGVKIDNISLSIFQEYVIKKCLICDELYDLGELYKHFSNQCYIVGLHGSDDDMIPIDEKREFADSIHKMVFMEIREEDLDGVVFKSCKHGLDGDFLKMFEFVYDNFESKLIYGNTLELPEKVELIFQNGKGIIVYYDRENFEVSLEVVK